MFKTHIIVGVAVLLLGAVTGCGPKSGGSAGPEGTYQAIIAVKKEATASFTEIKDEASAESALLKLEKIADRYVTLSGEMKGFNLSPDASEKLIDKYWKQEGEAGDELVMAAAAAKKRTPRSAGRIDEILRRFGIAQTTIVDGAGK